MIRGLVMSWPARIAPNNTFVSIVVTSLLSAFSSNPGLARRGDTCAAAQAIFGAGGLPFDNSLAMTDGTPDNLCLFYGQLQIEDDVWFS